jgi:hypothetical protein
LPVRGMQGVDCNLHCWASQQWHPSEDTLNEDD